MDITERVQRLCDRLELEPQYPTQGATVFIDLASGAVRQGYIPLEVVRTLLEGRGVNMYVLLNLLDPGLHPLHPAIPLIFGSGVLTGFVPSAARGNASSWSPESGVLMDSNCGDYFPAFLKGNGIDRLVLYNQAPRLSLVRITDGAVHFHDADCYRGLDNIDLRERVEQDFEGKWTRDLAMVNITSAGEHGVLTSGIMGGPKAIYARGGPGAKMGSLNLKAILLKGRTRDLPTASPYKPANRVIAKKLLETSVVKNALQVTGTPFLYRPSRILGAMGTKNNQETTWTDALDAEKIDPYRPGMAGCYRCPVNCRPLNDMSCNPEVPQDRYSKGDGPEYVTLGKFGPNIGIEKVEQVLRLNNICNDLGLDTASTGSAFGWAFELYQRGIITQAHTGGLELTWGNYPVIERLLFMLAHREGFGDVLADSTKAVERGHYPPEALEYLMAVKGLGQSDPHDARILKAFALGLAVATRGMDHLRNRVTLEINARINDDPAFKAELYGGEVSGKPNSYDGKEIAVRKTENVFAVGDAVGMCRFTTKLFNSPSLPGLEEFAEQIKNVTGLEFTVAQLEEIGLNIMGVERLINHRIGVRKQDDTVPKRWFEEPIKVGPFKGEKIDRIEFDRMLDRFYDLSKLNDEGIPVLEWRERLERVVHGFCVRVQLPTYLRPGKEAAVLVTRPVANIDELIDAVDEQAPGFREKARDSMLNFAVNEELVLHGAAGTPVRNGDVVEVVPMFAGG